MATTSTPKNTLLQKLAGVQINLKVPKDKTNTFGKYNYRSCEDILEAVKPLLNTAGLVLLINDEIVFIEGRFYVKATATVYDAETGESVYCSAYAREAETKAGTDQAQLTGACSSYARKYALNALLCIDDTKDADTDENATEAKARAQDAAKKTTAKPKAQASAPASTPATAPASAPEQPDARTQLRELIRKYNLDGTKIATDCKLSPKSTAEDYEKALAYAQAIVRKMEEDERREAYAQALAGGK